MWQTAWKLNESTFSYLHIYALNWRVLVYAELDIILLQIIINSKSISLSLYPV
jgi:hypothetical protein